jgi:hypothetical protein
VWRCTQLHPQVPASNVHRRVHSLGRSISLTQELKRGFCTTTLAQLFLLPLPPLLLLSILAEPPDGSWNGMLGSLGETAACRTLFTAISIGVGLTTSSIPQSMQIKKCTTAVWPSAQVGSMFGLMFKSLDCGSTGFRRHNALSEGQPATHCSRHLPGVYSR